MPTVRAPATIRSAGIVRPLQNLFNGMSVVDAGRNFDLTVDEPLPVFLRRRPRQPAAAELRDFGDAVTDAVAAGVNNRMFQHRDNFNLPRGQGTAVDRADRRLPASATVHPPRQGIFMGPPLPVDFDLLLLCRTRLTDRRSKVRGSAICPWLAAIEFVQRRVGMPDDCIIRQRYAFSSYRPAFPEFAVAGDQQQRRRHFRVKRRSHVVDDRLLAVDASFGRTVKCVIVCRYENQPSDLVGVSDAPPAGVVEPTTYSSDTRPRMPADKDAIHEARRTVDILTSSNRRRRVLDIRGLLTFRMRR